MENLKKEKTLVLLKPDTVQRALIGEIISRFERVGLKIVAMKFTLYIITKMMLETISYL